MFASFKRKTKENNNNSNNNIKQTNKQTNTTKHIINKTDAFLKLQLIGRKFHISLWSRKSFFIFFVVYLFWFVFVFALGRSLSVTLLWRHTFEVSIISCVRTEQTIITTYHGDCILVVALHLHILGSFIFGLGSAPRSVPTFFKI